LQELKVKYPNLKVVISLGGWTWSDKFSSIAATAAGRQAFAQSCIDMYINGNFATGLHYPGIFDGIDVDWEYPGSCGNTCNFTAQDPAERFVTAAGEHVLPSHTWNDATHTSMESTLGAVASAAAAMLSHRRVTITLHDVTLHHDHEMPHGTIGTVFGTAPADLASNVSVTYAPFLETTFGASVAGAIVSEQSVDARSAPFFQMNQDQTLDPAIVLFDAPVFDEQTQLHLVYELREVDHYPSFGIDELPSGAGSVLASIDADVDLTDHTIVIDTADVHASVDVHITTMW
jgi:hypothetical protein